MSRSFRVGWIFVTFALAAVVVLILLPPFVTETVQRHIMAGFAPLCHQMPERSFTIGGTPLAVGHRCTGVYVGLLGGALTLPWMLQWRDELRRYSPWILVGLLSLLTLDWMGPWIGSWVNMPGSRIATGLLFGFGAGYYAAEGLTQLLERILQNVAKRCHLSI